MPAQSDDSALETRVGTLRWNDFEGGFWSLEGDPSGTGTAPDVVLVGAPLPDAAADGARVEVRGRLRTDVADFLMAGARFEVVEARLA